MAVQPELIAAAQAGDSGAMTYRKIASLRAVGAFSGWLLSMVRRTCWRLARAFLGNALPLDSLFQFGAARDRRRR